MQNHATYCGRVKLDRHTPPDVLSVLSGLVTQKGDYVLPIEQDADAVFFQQPDWTLAFTDHGHSNGAVQPQASIVSSTRGYELRFCANAPDIGMDLYVFLVSWLAPWVRNVDGDLLIARLPGPYVQTPYRWTSLHWPGTRHSMAEATLPWAVCPQWFKPFMITHFTA